MFSRALLPRHLRAWRLAGLAAVLPLLAPSAPAGAQALFDFARSPETLVVRYAEAPGEVEHEEPGPSLAVYGDGRVLVHRPATLREAGDFALQLAPAELEALVASLVQAKLPEIDLARARAERRRAARGAPLAGESDVSTVSIELRLALYRSGAPDAPLRRNLVTRIRWAGLREDAERFPEVEALRQLDASRRVLEALMRRPDLERIR